MLRAAGGVACTLQSGSFSRALIANPGAYSKEQLNMSIVEIVLLGVALSMDAFAVTISNVFCYPNASRARLTFSSVIGLKGRPSESAPDSRNSDKPSCFGRCAPACGA
mgnify:CR=1 FL=1